ncbi:MAG TPA: bacteriohopanetetrol glucosamine biosynthesis glycosyltransferase HpnI [Stellaceae bacterium]|nr:bacteriohopanetetrol glucosamine biosynthesis glycosyltransferase HpnI [Stellaceae bacterium]
MSWLIAALVLLPVWAYLAVVVVAAAAFARRRAVAPATRPPVTVLKPLHGAEPGLRENLLSFVDQDYPALQVVFGVRNPADEAVPTVQTVIRSRPGRDLALVVDPRAGGSNLKVANLENMLPTARYDILVMADADMRVEPGYLAAVTAPLHAPGIGLVTCLYKGVPTGGFWSELGALHINYGFLPSALVGEVLGAGGGCFGATIALRRDVLDRIGGFASLRDELADDHRAGDAVRELGLKTVLSPYLVENRVTEPSFAGLWRHELRWARTVRAMAPLGFAGSAITHSVAIAALVMIVSRFSAAACWLVLVACGLRWATALAAGRLLGLPIRRLWLLPLRDALSFAVFVGSFCGRSVQWRGQLFRVEPNGRMSADGDTLG